MNTIFMYSGQGSQYYQMGKDLFEADVNFREHLKSLDQIMLTEFGYSVLEKIFDPSKKKSDMMDDIELSSAAIYMMEIATTRIVEDKGIKANYLLGASLGTFAAATRAGCFTPEKYLITLVQATQIIKKTCDPGVMIAVLGDVKSFESNTILYDHADLAAVNFKDHFTISTSLANLSRVAEILNSEKTTYFQLPVNRAYHSRWLDSAKKPIQTFFDDKGFNAPTIPLICCAACMEINQFSAKEIWNTMRNPILFAETVHNIEKNGPHLYIDVGPSGTLATFLKYVLPQDSKSEIMSILGPMLDGVCNLKKLNPN